MIINIDYLLLFSMVFDFSPYYLPYLGYQAITIGWLNGYIFLLVKGREQKQKTKNKNYILENFYLGPVEEWRKSFSSHLGWLQS